jgi:23S rRNA pseudouridine2605 synthase
LIFILNRRILMKERLQKVMAHAGVASRRKSEEIIRQGSVRVNGEIVKEVGIKVNLTQDIIEVNGETISREKFIYIILNKPSGYITTVNDPEGRPKVLDLIKGITQRIYPVGRLDYDTSGLLLLTNDGEITYILTHPSHLIDKTYRVELAGHHNINRLIKLEKGILLDDGMTAPACIEKITYNNNNTIFNFTIHEGRNRQVRKMIEAIGLKLIKLKRISFGPLILDGLQEGKFRLLNNNEIKSLKEIKISN